MTGTDVPAKKQATTKVVAICLKNPLFDEKRELSQAFWPPAVPQGRVSISPPFNLFGQRLFDHRISFIAEYDSDGPEACQQGRMLLS